jgi:hypothetical protein
MPEVLKGTHVNIVMRPNAVYLFRCVPFSTLIFTPLLRVLGCGEAQRSQEGRYVRWLLCRVHGVFLV